VPEPAGPDPCRVRPGGRRRPDARQAQWQASPAGYIAPAQRLSGCVRLRRLAAGNLWKIRSAPGYAERQTRPAGRPDRLYLVIRRPSAFAHQLHEQGIGQLKMAVGFRE
jgi:hypothetical protein